MPKLLIVPCVMTCVVVHAVFLPAGGPPSKANTKPGRGEFRTLIRGKGKHSKASLGIGALPTGKKFVIVIRGQSFRYRNTSMGERGERLFCQDYANEWQLGCSQSFLEKVIKPLEQHGNQVKILITDTIEDPTESLIGKRATTKASHIPSTFPSEKEDMKPQGACHLTPLIEQKFNANSSEKRVARTAYMESRGQPWNIRNALEFLKETFGGADGVRKEFDYVMVLRHDLSFEKDITQWDTTLDRFNFFSRCESPAARSVGGDKCVWDTIHLMPSNLFGVFDETVGTKGCFNEYNVEHHNRFVGHGHGCFKPLQAALNSFSAGAEIGFLTNLRHRVRGETGIVDLVLPKWPPADGERGLAM